MLPLESLLVTTGRGDVKSNTNLRLNSRGEGGDSPRGGSSTVTTDSGPCSYAVCLTHPQLISVSVITILIILVVLTISLVALKRQNQFRRTELMASKKVCQNLRIFLLLHIICSWLSAMMHQDNAKIVKTAYFHL